MKILICFFTFSFASYAAVEALSATEEIPAIDHLIEAAERRLADAKILREFMVQFKTQREEFLRGKQTKAHAALMVRTARRILDEIRSQHVEYLFSSDYLEELAVFSSVAIKRSPARP